MPVVSDPEGLWAREFLVRTGRLVDPEGEVATTLHHEHRRRHRREARKRRARGRQRTQRREVRRRQRPGTEWLELRGQQVVTPSGRDVTGAMQLLLSHMPRKDAELLRRTLAVVKQSDDEHACWATRTIYHYLSQLPDQPRRDLTRALFSS